MAIDVTKMPDFKKVLKTLSATDEEIISVATKFVVDIQKRTQRGTDADGKSFNSYAPYDDQYKRYRNSKGRSSRVNLTFNGHMLNGMQVKKYRGGAMIFFKNKENDKAYYNHQKRKFFALDDDQVDYMYKRIGTFIAKGLK